VAEQPRRRNAALRRVIQLAIIIVLLSFIAGGVAVAAFVLAVMALLACAYVYRKRGRTV
jgi:hypothetical protein